MSLPLALAVVQVVSTLFMCGLIWLVQVVHYPLFAHVGDAEYVGYQQRHMRLVTWVVGPAMLIETTAAVGLWFLSRDAGPAWQHDAGLALLAVIWASTAFLQVPCHERLTRGFDAGTHQRLVSSNWIRTIAWTARAPITIALLLVHA